MAIFNSNTQEDQ